MSQQDEAGNLILSRWPGEALCIGPDIKVEIIQVQGQQVRLGVRAPKGIPVWREAATPAR